MKLLKEILNWMTWRRAPTVETDVAACLPILKLQSAQLRSIADEIETKVVKTCESLTGVMADTNRVVRAASVCMEGNDNHMGGEQLISATRDVLSNLVSVTGSLGEIGSISEVAKIVALNGKIEAARAGRHGAAFAVVVNETSALADKAKGTSEVVTHTVDALENIVRSKSRQERGDAKPSEHCATLIQEMLDQLDEYNDVLGDGLGELSEASQSIGKEVSNAIVSLQFQDSVNQRLAHVIEVLDEIEGKLAPHAIHANQNELEKQLADWSHATNEKYTMNAERVQEDASLGKAESTVELF